MSSQTHAKPPQAANSSATRGLLLMALANIRRERLRTSLLLLTISLATLLFITSLASMAGMQAPVEAMLEKQHSSHELISFDSRVYPPSQIVDWWRTHGEVESVSPLLPFVSTTGRPVHNGDPFGDTLRLTERPVGGMEIDLLAFMQGEEAPYPAPGEIWLPTNTAKSADLKPGDIIEIAMDEGAVEFTLSAVVVDPQYSNGFTNPVRAWVAPGELAGIYTPRMLQNYQLAVRLKEGANQEEIWKSFSSNFEGGFSGGHLTYQDTVNAYGTILRILAVMILIFGLMSLGVALFIISSTISGVILANYRTFGVLKALGYTPGNVSSIFQLQFLVMSLIAVPLGIIGGWFVSRRLIAIMLESIGSIDAALPFAAPATGTMILMVGLIAFTAAVAGRKAGKIKAATSIRFGAPEQGVKRRSPVKLTWARHLPLSLVIGLKNVASGGRRVVYDLVVFTVTAFVLFFSINVHHSMKETGNNLPFWGFDASEITIKMNLNNFTMRYDKMKEYLLTVPGVEAMAGMTISGDVVLPATQGRVARSLSGHIIDGDADAMGFINLTGKNPAVTGEVSLGVNLALDYGISVGDTMKLDVFGQPLEFEVSGIFQGTSNNGYWYRMTMGSVLQADPNFVPDTVGMISTEDVDRQIIMDNLEAQLGEAVDVEAAEAFVEAQLNQIVSGIGMVVAFLSIVFLLVSSVSIFNSTTMSIHESRRQLGIYNALGYTRTQIRLILVNKSALVGLFATGLGLAIFLLFTGSIMSALTSGMGMPVFPVFINVTNTILAVPLIIAVCMISAWIPSNSVSKIKARTLIVE